MRAPRSRFVGALLIAFFFVAALWFDACGAYCRPEAVTDVERQLLETPPLPYAVSVVPWNAETARRTGQNPQAYARPAARLLKASGAFRESRFENQPSGDAALVATSTGTHCNSAVVPLLTIVSLGVIPTVFDDTDCEGIELRRASGASSNSVKIEYRHKGKVVMGWAAVVVGALPGWSWGGVRDDSRYAEHFRLEVIRRRYEIERLLQP